MESWGTPPKPPAGRPLHPLPLNFHLLSCFGAATGREDHGYALDIVGADGLRGAALPQAAHEVLYEGYVAGQGAPDLRRHFQLRMGGEPGSRIMSGGGLRPDAVRTVPAGRAELPDHAPLALPGGGQPLGGPASTVGVGHPA